MGPAFRNFLLGVTLAAPLGPAGIAIVQNGIRSGFGTAFTTAIGVTLADTTYLLVVYFGVSALVDNSMIQVALLSAGAAVLIVLGVRSIRDAGSGIDPSKTAFAPGRNPLLVGYVVNISNPLAIVWWVGIFGATLGSLGGVAPRATVLANTAVILVGILTWHTGLAFLTHWGRHFLTERILRAISIVAGMALVAFGVRFIFSAVTRLLAVP